MSLLPLNKIPLNKMISDFSSLGIKKNKPPKNKNPIRLINCSRCNSLIPTSNYNPTCQNCLAHKMLNTEALANNNLKPASIESDGSLLASSGDSKGGGRKKKKIKRENQKKQKDVVKRKKENPKNDVKRKRKRVKKSNLIIKI